MKRLDTYVNQQLNISSYVNEYLVGKITHYDPNKYHKEYEYFPQTKVELIETCVELYRKGIYDFNCIDTSKITIMSRLISVLKENYFIDITKIDISKWDMSNVEYTSGMFRDCKELTEMDFSNWDVSKLKEADGMFCNCTKLKFKGLEKWNTQNLENAVAMFSNCRKLKGEGMFENWNVSNLINCYQMFADCIYFNCDLSNWNMRNVEKLTAMFNGCKRLQYNMEGWSNTITKSKIKNPPPYAVFYHTPIEANRQLPSWEFHQFYK